MTEFEASPASEADESPTWKIVLGLAVQATLFTLLGIYLWYESGRPLAEFVEVDGRAIMLGMALGGIMIALAYCVFKGLPTVGERLIRMQAKTYAFLGDRLSLPMIVLISIGAGIGEEALFRGGLQTLLTDYIGPLGAITVASAVFAAIHLSKPPIMALIFAIGVLFGVVYWATGSLLIVMIAHTVYDIFALDWLLKEFRRLGCMSDGKSMSDRDKEA